MQVGFKMFLGKSAQVGEFNSTDQSFHLILEENPLVRRDLFKPLALPFDTSG